MLRLVSAERKWLGIEGSRRVIRNVTKLMFLLEARSRSCGQDEIEAIWDPEWGF